MKTTTKKTKKTKGWLYATILGAALLVASLIVPVLRGESPIELGLDLAGGVIVTYRPDFASLESAGEVDRAEVLALAKETLTSRLYRSLDTVPDVVVRGDQRIVVSLPSRHDDHRVLELVGEAGAGRRGWTIRRLYSLAAEGGTLLHANLTTLIVIALLLGTERLRSFAVFIFVGIVASVATIFVTRRLLTWSHGRLGGLGPDLLGWLRRRQPGVFRWRRAYFTLIVALLTAGLLVAPQLELGADFRAGTQLIVAAPDESRVAAAGRDLASRFPEIDARRQVLGDPEDGRYLVTLGAALEIEDSDPRRLRADQVLSIFAARSVEVESVSSIDGRLSSRRLLGSLTVLGLSFLLLAIYLVACQEPLERVLSARHRPALPAAARLTVFTGVLAAVAVDVAIVLAVAALLEIPINLPVIAGLLTILGYSVNDSVVLWENVRRRWSELGQETNLPDSVLGAERTAAEVVTQTVDAVLSRTLLTSVSTLVPALVILMVGLTPLLDFARVMIAGVVSGTLSSIFVVGVFAVRALERQPAPRPSPKRLAATMS